MNHIHVSHLKSRSVGRPRSILDRLKKSALPAAAPDPALVDRTLVERAQAGDRKAFGDLYTRHLDDVFSYVLFRVRDRSLAENLTQDVFERAYKGLGNFRWQGGQAGKLRGGIKAWLLTIARNTIANHWRSVNRRPVCDRALEEGDEDENLSLQSRLEDPEAAREMRNVDLHLDADSRLALLSRLSEAQQEVLVLRFVWELSIAQTAALMDRSQKSIANLQYYGLKAMRMHLDADEDHPEPGSTRQTRAGSQASPEENRLISLIQAEEGGAQ